MARGNHNFRKSAILFFLSDDGHSGCVTAIVIPGRGRDDSRILAGPRLTNSVVTANAGTSPPRLLGRPGRLRPSATTAADGYGSPGSWGRLVVRGPSQAKDRLKLTN